MGELWVFVGLLSAHMTCSFWFGLYKYMALACAMHVSQCVCCTFGLCGGAVRVPQCQQRHLYQLVEQQISLDQHKLSMFLPPLSLHGALRVLHHAEYWQQAA